MQDNQSALHDELLQTVKPDESLCEQILSMGFDVELVREVLKNTTNDMQKAIENLLKLQADGTYADALKEVIKNASISQSAFSGLDTPSTSSTPSTSQLLNHIQNHEEEMQANEPIGSNKN